MERFGEGQGAEQEMRGGRRTRGKTERQSYGRNRGRDGQRQRES